ncbi:MAG: tetratricopeptide repeat protein [Ignavibacteriales bacterium]|nr:tetratricopeptide repeat protein [Ignavibacteriales bacterium]
MFTDIVGYTLLMQENEKSAKELRDRHRRVLEKCVLLHKGSILQYYGDGTLTIFGSVIEAVKCAISIQKELQKEPKIPLRIGIHAGDIVYDDDGVYGDGVNIASRIQSLSVPGGILISDKVNDEIRNHEELDVILMGEFRLKNVKRPLEIYAIKSEGIVIPDSKELESKAGFSSRSIAVLPFLNMSTDIENEYFSDGITEEIINALTKVEGLKVTSRTSSFAFKGKNLDIRQIGNQLNVSTVLEGSVRKFGNKVRVTAQLINIADGYHFWSEVYDRNLEDIFQIQDEISRHIAERFKAKTNVDLPGKPLVKAYTKNIDAYNLYLKGLFYFGKWTPENIQKGISLFEEAIEKEPYFALPYSGLANCYVVLSATGVMTPAEAYSKAQEAALKAIALDENIAESHISLALVRMFNEWEWEGALSSFERAMEINFGSSVVHQAYSLYLMAKGDLEESIKEMELAYSLDPLSIILNNELGEVYLYAERHDDALKQFEKTLELDPNFWAARLNFAKVLLIKGETHKSIDILKEVRRSANDGIKCLPFLACAYTQIGKMEEVQKLIEEILNYKKENDVSYNLELATLYAGTDNAERMYLYLEEAYKEKIGGMIFLKVFPIFKKFRNDPRFLNLLTKIGLDK